MAETTLILNGSPAFVATAALTAGDVITLDANGQWAVTAAAEEVFFVALKDAALGAMVAGVRARIMKVKCQAVNNSGNSAIAVGDKLYVGAGQLTKNNVTGLYAVAKALETLATGTTGIIRVLVKE